MFANYLEFSIDIMLNNFKKFIKNNNITYNNYYYVTRQQSDIIFSEVDIKGESILSSQKIFNYISRKIPAFNYSIKKGLLKILNQIIYEKFNYNANYDDYIIDSDKFYLLIQYINLWLGIYVVLTKVNKTGTYNNMDIHKSLLTKFDSSDFQFVQITKKIIQSSVDQEITYIQICEILNNFLKYYLKSNEVFKIFDIVINSNHYKLLKSPRENYTTTDSNPYLNGYQNQIKLMKSPRDYQSNNTNNTYTNRNLIKDESILVLKDYQTKDSNQYSNENQIINMSNHESELIDYQTNYLNLFKNKKIDLDDLKYINEIKINENKDKIDLSNLNELVRTQSPLNYYSHPMNTDNQYFDESLNNILIRSNTINSLNEIKPEKESIHSYLNYNDNNDIENKCINKNENIYNYMNHEAIYESNHENLVDNFLNNNSEQENKNSNQYDKTDFTIHKCYDFDNNGNFISIVEKLKETQDEKVNIQIEDCNYFSNMKELLDKEYNILDTMQKNLSEPNTKISKISTNAELNYLTTTELGELNTPKFKRNLNFTNSTNISDDKYFKFNNEEDNFDLQFERHQSKYQLNFDYLHSENIKLNKLNKFEYYHDKIKKNIKILYEYETSLTKICNLKKYKFNSFKELNYEVNEINTDIPKYKINDEIYNQYKIIKELFYSNNKNSILKYDLIYNELHSYVQNYHNNENEPQILLIQIVFNLVNLYKSLKDENTKQKVLIEKIDERFKEYINEYDKKLYDYEYTEQLESKLKIYQEKNQTLHEEYLMLNEKYLYLIGISKHYKDIMTRLGYVN